MPPKILLIFLQPLTPYESLGNPARLAPIVRKIRTPFE
jgi:hypothetical protein